MADAPRVLGRETLSDGFFRLERVTVAQRTRDGACQEVAREVYHNGPGAAVPPVDHGRGMVLLTRQLRVPALANGHPPFVVEACAGLVEQGRSPAETARREAAEELGVRLRGPLRPVCAISPSPGASAETIHLFLADYTPADRDGAGGGLADEGEDIGVLERPLDEALDRSSHWLANDATGDGRVDAQSSLGLADTPPGLRLVDAKTLILLAAAREERDRRVRRGHEPDADAAPA